jgi:hypothetical protein
MSPTLKLALDVTLLLMSVALPAWLLWRAGQRGDRAAMFLFKTILTLVLIGGEVGMIHLVRDLPQEGLLADQLGWALLLVGSVAGLGIVLSLLWTPHIGNLLVSPLTNWLDGGGEPPGRKPAYLAALNKHQNKPPTASIRAGREPPERKPAYSAALTKRKNSRPLEAIVAVREQLAKFPNDFKGIMLLAKIQAEDLDDLYSAEITLNRFCDAPGVSDREVVTALTQLADWHLNLAEDVDSALATLQKLVARFPDKEFSRRAVQRFHLLDESGTQTKTTTDGRTRNNAPKIRRKLSD